VVEVTRNGRRGPSAADVARIVLVAVAVVLCLALIYALRQPLTWLFIALFLAVALAPPVAFFARRMRRGFAITVVYLLLIGIPALLGSLLIPPIVRSIADFAENVPEYAADLRQFVSENERLREIDAEYDLTGKVQEQAGKLPDQVGAAAGTLGDIGAGIVSSTFALVTILILTAFLLGSGARWYEGFLAMQPAERRDRLRRVLERSAGAVSGYVAGALLQATVAALTALIVLSILGVPFAAALSVVMFFADLVPVVGATIGAVVVGLFTIFADFPTATIVWVAYSIVYQQFENSVIQPQIQKRTVNVNGFIVVVSVLFGTTLFGVLGALTAIPVAAMIQIAVREWWAWRLEQRQDPAAGAVTSTGA
jgi:predicted PurR-regulated permease PerM